LWSDEQRKQAGDIDAELKKLAEERQAGMDKIVADIFEAEVARLAEDQRELAKAARDTAAKDRTPEHKQILKDHPSLNVSRGSAYLYDKKRVDAITKEFDAKQKELQARRPAEDFVPCLTEVPGKIPQTFVFYRGDIQQPKEAVEPGELSVLNDCDDESKIQNPKSKISIPTDDPAAPTTGRRLAYARWLTSGEQPLVPRVLVNRVWMLHFGRGIVATPGDFGFLGARPSHPELLDWLANEFVYGRSEWPTRSASRHDLSRSERSTFDGGWELKRLHRLIMSSAAYRQRSNAEFRMQNAELAHDAALANPQSEFRNPQSLDPDNTLLWRQNLRRLEAEAVRDSILAATGQVNQKMYGPPVPVTVDEVGQVIVGLDNRDSAGRPQGKRGALGSDEYRRSVYVQVRRSQPLSMLETFDAPALNPNCEIRNRSTVAPQSLLLMNNEFVLAQSQALAQRVIDLAGKNRREQVRLAWRLALSQEPDESNIDAAVAFVAEQEQELSVQPPDKAPPAETGALASFCQALFSSNAFLYVD
jgi:hypothetical protein